jgi:hypothetical protein
MHQTLKIQDLKWFIDERILKHMVYVFEYDSTETIERIGPIILSYFIGWFGINYCCIVCLARNKIEMT